MEATKMRYQLSESSYIVAQFPTGHTVTIDIYKLSDSTKIISAASMAEIGSTGTGLFKYQQTLDPIIETEYLWIATDGYDTKAGKIVLGGYPDTITASQAAEASSISTINGNVATIQSDEATIKASQTSAASDISTIKADEATIKGNVATIQSDEATIKASQTSAASDISTIKADEATIKGSQTAAAGNISTIMADEATIKADEATIKGSQISTASDISTIKASQVGEEANITTILSRVPARGSGAITWTYTLTDSETGLPIADTDIWISTDIAGVNVIANQRTNQYGIASFMLDAGTVYVWRAKTGYSFTDPDTEVVS
jgi:hypothetical protein